MGATGVVAKEYRSKLDELATRLGLSLDAAKLMFHAAIRQRMGPMMQQVSFPETAAAFAVARSELSGSCWGGSAWGRIGGRLSAARRSC